ncbi:MAG: Crp/Fnr family transcriptional regulator [Pseudonocardiaceae bacterium]
MAHVILVGSSPNSFAYRTLLDSGHQLTLASSAVDAFLVGRGGPPLLLAGIDGETTIPSVGAAATHNGVPWIAWNLTDSTDVALAAYEAGASAVLPSAFSAAAFDGIVCKISEGQDASVVAASEPPLRSHQPGDRIPLQPEAVLWVRQGVVALTGVHEDGVESLTGFCGPGQLATGSADPGWQPVAHTAAVVATQPWSLASRLPHFSERLRERLREAEEWTHNRGHHRVDARLCATLALLARKFGVASPAGTLVELDLTHAQLAAATASTRATVTRRLAALCRRGLLSTVSTEAGTRFVLAEPATTCLPPPRSRRSGQ